MSQIYVVPVDGSEQALLALDVALSLAKATNGRLVLAHIIDSAKAARLSFGDPALVDGCYDALRADGAFYLDQAVQRAKLAGAHPETITAYGDPSTEIVKIAAQKCAAMIVMGTHGRTGLTHLLLGSVAEGVMRHATVPVVVVPPAARAAEHATVA